MCLLATITAEAFPKRGGGGALRFARHDADARGFRLNPERRWLESIRTTGGGGGVRQAGKLAEVAGWRGPLRSEADPVICDLLAPVKRFEFV